MQSDMLHGMLSMFLPLSAHKSKQTGNRMQSYVATFVFLVFRWRFFTSSSYISAGFRSLAGLRGRCESLSETLKQGRHACHSLRMDSFGFFVRPNVNTTYGQAKTSHIQRHQGRQHAKPACILLAFTQKTCRRATPCLHRCRLTRRE